MKKKTKRNIKRDKNKIQKKFSRFDIKSHLLKLKPYINQELLEIIQVQLLSKKKKIIHYSENMKVLAVSLYLGLKARAYKIMAQMFHLPSVASVLKYISGIDCLSGIDNYQISLLKSRIGTKTYEKACFILIDEMSIRKVLH